MVEFLGMEFSILQIVLIIALILTPPLGYWNQRRMIKRKQEVELLGDDIDSISSANNNFNAHKNTNLNVSQEIELKAKEYIEQYQSSYPKESIQQGLLNFNITNGQASALVNKYYKQ
ncbi:MAG: hypothetical protein ACLFPL_05350 [Candidatus Nanoarchaeia archaeon]